MSVYPNSKNKPSLGVGLNKECIIELMNIWPARRDHKSHKAEMKEQMIEAFCEKLKQVNAQSDSQFISYNSEDGIWTFKVKHFSDYGFTESDEEEIYGDEAEDVVDFLANASQSLISQNALKDLSNFGMVLLNEL